MDVGFEDILRFWFPPALDTADIATQARRIEWWFRGGANSEIADSIRRSAESSGAR